VQLVIRDLVFPIESATLQAGMWDPYWSNKWNGGRTPKPMLSLELQAAELEHGDTMWAPRLYNEWLPFPSQDWRDIANRTITWRTASTPPAPMITARRHRVVDAVLAGEMPGGAGQHALLVA
jgi:hypothetical protein